MSQKLGILSIMILCLLGLGGIFMINYICTPKTPLAAFEKSALYSDAVLNMSKLIGEVELENKTLMIYYNSKGHVNGVIAKKNKFGYEITEAGGCVATYNKRLRTGLLAFGYSKAEEWVYFGIIYDPRVKEVEWQGVKANPLPNEEGLGLVYGVGKGSFYNGAYHLYDDKQNELENIIKNNVF